ncbi:MAG: polyprenyl synthetase family protein [Planctomycetota bacterium]|nr:polyprenyl synthetase family protein [Planctomycetota bacterium]MDA0932266.1 polyprenyl synthetase family protein [Planctomycetota bacterium]
MTDAAPAVGARFLEFAARHRPAVEAELERLIPSAEVEPRALHAAMRHAMFPGGKRLRPVLALLAAEATGGDPRAALRPAAALELVHTYSLVHDDLPCMDDDALRRGRPTCHVAFGEANALLAGDALLTLAFEAVAEGGASAVKALAAAAGSLGMVGGQVGDLEAEGLGGDLTLERLEWIHDRKTGALIVASLEVGVFAGGGDPAALDAIRSYGRTIGRAFQVADDILDVTGTAEALGKMPGQDAAHGKSTYPSLLGLDGAMAAADRLAAEAAVLAESACRSGPDGAGLESRVGLLQDLAYHVVARKT